MLGSLENEDVAVTGGETALRREKMIGCDRYSVGGTILSQAGSMALSEFDALMGTDPGVGMTLYDTVNDGRLGSGGRCWWNSSPGGGRAEGARGAGG